MNREKFVNEISLNLIFFCCAHGPTNRNRPSFGRRRWQRTAVRRLALQFVDRMMIMAYCLCHSICIFMYEIRFSVVSFVCTNVAVHSFVSTANAVQQTILFFSLSVRMQRVTYDGMHTPGEHNMAERWESEKNVVNCMNDHHKWDEKSDNNGGEQCCNI